MSALNGKRCLITGASGGLGAALAREFGRHGCRLILTGRDRRRLEETAATLADTAPGIATFTADLAASESRHTLVGQVLDAAGGIDILVNNAGSFPVGPVTEASLEEIQQCLAVNLDAPTHLCHAFIPGMIELGWGRIVNVASSSSYAGFADTAAYCASKHGLLGLSRALDPELRPHGIRVVCAAPGSIMTEMGRKVPGQTFETFMTPDEVASEIVHATALDGSVVINELRLGRMVMG